MAWKMSQETELTLPRNLTITVPQSDNDNDSDNDNERNYNEERSEITISSQAASTTNGTRSSPANISCEIAYGPNSPTTKRKWTSDVWNTIKRIRNKPELSTEYEGMTHICLKCGQILKCTKEKRKGIWLTTRALDHIKKCEKRDEYHSNAADKSSVTEEVKRVKVQCNLYDAGQGYFSKHCPREQMLTTQARYVQ